ncbi:MAG: D-alanyl-D-alanine carboxypeptidase, partial [Actinomycetota bacterium]|nr:D-alanyl-D-alanine carboxypeptidase [Actinomycetota bacterium]
MARLVSTLILLACLLAPAAAAGADRAATRAELGRQMRLAGAGSGALVVDLDAGEELYASRPDTPRVPASVEKLYTTTAALLRLGP